MFLWKWIYSLFIWFKCSNSYYFNFLHFIEFTITSLWLMHIFMIFSTIMCTSLFDWLPYLTLHRFVKICHLVSTINKLPIHLNFPSSSLYRPNIISSSVILIFSFAISFNVFYIVLHTPDTFLHSYNKSIRFSGCIPFNLHVPLDRFILCNLISE